MCQEPALNSARTLQATTRANVRKAIRKPQMKGPARKQMVSGVWLKIEFGLKSLYKCLVELHNTQIQRIFSLSHGSEMKPRGQRLKTNALIIVIIHKGHGGWVVVFGAFGEEGCWFESHSSRHIGTLGKSFTRSCLYDVMWRPAWLSCN